ncbi:hypothetical protein [Anaerovorax odorimutans]|uniref:hypothetical protein n=1 Tax=Anaerovorax odorimutans TaxID=109327 RepID=UPI0012EC3DC8|nr:hypothetical protein [Anaerovorax odorimutans]
MSKVSLVLYYWITIVIASLIAKFAGFGDSKEAVLKMLIVVSVLYIIAALTYNSRHRS